jgi:hypothetical protein
MVVGGVLASRDPHDGTMDMRLVRSQQAKQANRPEAWAEQFCDLPVWTQTRLQNETASAAQRVRDLQHWPSDAPDKDKGVGDLIVCVGAYDVQAVLPGCLFCKKRKDTRISQEGSDFLRVIEALRHL